MAADCRGHGSGRQQRGVPGSSVQRAGVPGGGLTEDPCLLPSGCPIGQPLLPYPAPSHQPAHCHLPPYFPRYQAMSVVLAYAAYLPSAQCFALLPLVGGFRRTGSASGAVLDYDLERQAVTLVAQRPYRWGRRVGGLLGWWDGLGGGREVCVRHGWHARLQHITEQAALANLCSCLPTDQCPSPPPLPPPTAARARRCPSTTAGPTASCCWPPAHWRRATPQVRGQGRGHTAWHGLLQSAAGAHELCMSPSCLAAAPPLQATPRVANTSSRPAPPRPADCLFMETGLVAADRLYSTKRQILEELGLGGWQGGEKRERRVGWVVGRRHA